VAKPAKNDRQKVIDDIRSKQKGAERNRGLAIVGVCVVVAVLILAYPLYGIIKDKKQQSEFESMNLDSIGAPASVCQDVTTKPATGNQQHVEPGTPIPYEDAPPAFGTHYNVWDTIERKMYTAEDRPDLGELVHNLEHGFTILWYDETIAKDDKAMNELEGIAAKFDTDDDNYRNKFKIVPWTSEDENGATFPDGQHIALTHWSVGGDSSDTSKQVGVWQYCSAVSGAAVYDFVQKYPYTDSPEPNAI
jgi:Protein of unknown function (DUF3105)